MDVLSLVMLVIMPVLIYISVLWTMDTDLNDNKAVITTILLISIGAFFVAVPCILAATILMFHYSVKGLWEVVRDHYRKA